MARDIIVPHNPHLDLAKNLGASYATAVRANGLIYVSGQVAIDSASGARQDGAMMAQTRQVMGNIAEVLDDAGSSLSQVVKVNAFLHSMLEADNFNKAYGEFFPGAPPARTVCGSALHAGMKVQVDCVAAEGSRETISLARTAIAPNNPLLNASRQGNRPHVPGIRLGDLIFVSGMVPTDPVSGEPALGPIADQIAQVFTNMGNLLIDNGSSLANVVKLTVVLADIADHNAAVGVIRTVFPQRPPAVTIVGMQLSYGNGVEIEAVALG